MKNFDLLFDEIGHFGIYQLILIAVLFLEGILIGVQNIASVFYGAEQDHWCRVQRLENFTYEQQKYIAIPWEDGSEEEYDMCSMYDLPWEEYSDWDLAHWNRSLSEGAERISCNSWVHDMSQYASTIITEWDLVCDKSWYVAMTTTVYMFGLFIGSAGSGIISDRFGRVKTLMMCVFLWLVFGVAGAFAPNVIGFAIMRFFVCTFANGTYFCAFVLIMEIIGPRWRLHAAIIFSVSLSIGFMIMAGMAALITDFRMLQLATGIPTAALLLYYWIVPESPRWLITQGKRDEAILILENMTKFNKTKLPENIDFYISNEETDEQKEEQKKATFFDILRNPFLLKVTLISWLIWITTTLVYYGILFNSASLAGNVYLNTFLSGAMELPTQFLSIPALMKAGRRLTIGIPMAIAGLINLGCIPVLDNDDLGWLLTTLTILGKSVLVISFQAIYIHATELYPTPVRHLGLGSMSTVARIGSMSAPFFAGPLQDVWLPLPSLIFGIMGLLSGFLTFALPETLNRKLPDTLQEAMDLAKKESDKDEQDTVTSPEANGYSPFKDPEQYTYL